MTRLAIDPVSRVNGHLRVEADVPGRIVADAWVSGQAYRGIERILSGRDPRDAWLVAQRVCGVCTGAHAFASVRAVENALGVSIPANARLIRDIMAGSSAVVAHAAGFYLRQAFDWVDPTTAVRADPRAASALAATLGDRSDAGEASFRSVRDRVSVALRDQTAPFASRSWGHPAYSLPPEASLIVLAHYFEAIDWQREMNRLQVVLGGKSPHPQTLLVGGMAVAPPWGGPTRPDAGQHPWRSNRKAPAPLSTEGLADVAALLEQARSFVHGVYVPDVLTLAEHYGEWARVGLGIGHYLSFGAYPEDGTGESLLLPRGRVMDRGLSEVVDVGEAGVAETVAHAHYLDDAGGALRHPRDAITEPAYAGPPPPFTTIEGFDRYSWTKAPRYEDDPMEVGPAARMIVAYAAGREDVVTVVDRTMARLGLPTTALGSTLGRIVARAVEAQVVVDRLAGWLTELRANLASGDLAIADITKWDPATWPSDAEGWSLGESPGGAVGHWLGIHDRRIEAYQIVDASTWNASPRDQRGRRGAIEEALVGTPVADRDRSVEILRTVRSFDPCIACAVH